MQQKNIARKNSSMVKISECRKSFVEKFFIVHNNFSRSLCSVEKSTKSALKRFHICCYLEIKK
jgi:hypothetical protein